MLQVTLFTMAGPAIMPFSVNRFKSEIRFFVKKSGILFLGHIAQPDGSLVCVAGCDGV